jgi:hypothetical protein
MNVATLEAAVQANAAILYGVDLHSGVAAAAPSQELRQQVFDHLRRCAYAQYSSIACFGWTGLDRRP